jgi:CubicO group peptidase (beta-lactamase class C family)
MAEVYTQDENRKLVLVDPPASDAIDWTPGGSGLVSTAGDYMRFGLMLWNGGEYDGTRILSQDSVDLMTQPHVASGVLEEEDIEGLGWGLGIAVVVDAEATPMIDRDGDFWWSGYYGTTFFVSPESGLVGVVLTQNQPSEFSRRPYAIYLAQAFAFLGL